MRRTQIYLDEEQAARLDDHAAAEGATRSTVIRRAVDEYLTGGERDAAEWRNRWSEAIQRTAGIAPGLEEGAEYVEDLRRGDVARLLRLGS